MLGVKICNGVPSILCLVTEPAQINGRSPRFQTLITTPCCNHNFICKPCCLASLLPQLMLHQSASGSRLTYSQAYALIIFLQMTRRLEVWRRAVPGWWVYRGCVGECSCGS